MTRPKHFPPVQYLNECFSYDPQTGELRWRQRPEHHFATDGAGTTWNTRFAGKPAFQQVTSEGYRRGRVAFDGCYFRMMAHRVAFALMTGQHPTEQIDHIDHDRLNNKWKNLREATSVENRWNSERKPGMFPSGVQKNGKNGYEARIYNRGKATHLGTFRTVAEAAEARDRAVIAQRAYFMETAQ